MAQIYLIDTGPIVAMIDQRDQWHSWAVHELQKLAPPLYTCEAVISEAHFLLGQVNNGRAALLGMLTDGLIQIPWQLSEELTPVKDLLLRYQSVPMSLADACLVRMAEQLPGSKVFTIDGDFRIYRMNRNQPIPILMPDAR
jgi:uncharacterized protein